MIDIVGETGSDMTVFDTQTEKAANILGTQIGYLEYLPDLGIDLRYFLTEAVQFQNESFQAHLIEMLARNGINVSTITSIVNTLFSDYLIEITKQETSTGFVAR